MHALSCNPYSFQMKRLQVLHATDASLFETSGLTMSVIMAHVQATGAILDAVPNVEVGASTSPCMRRSA